MNTAAYPARAATGFTGWLLRAEAWLDDKGKGAWIAAMVLAFIFVWPLGLALLAYMIWSKKMICTRATRRTGGPTSRRDISRPTGNSAFDAYRAETLERLEREQENFEAFLQRLRDARDKAEFDQFMEERASAARNRSKDEGSEDRDTPGSDAARPA